MGSIVGAALVSHVPPIVLPEEERRELNEGEDTTLVAGLEQIRTECFDRLRPDTVVVFDTHWFTTVEHIVAAHERRAGRYTSEELPRGMAGVAYDLPGDPELAHAVAALGEEREDTWVLACDDPHLPIHYPTVNLLGFLQGGERWVSIGLCQTAEPDDFLLLGSLLGAAIDSLDRRVVLLASGGLSHRFWPLREFRQHESADLANIRTPGARRADEQIIGWMESGDHAAILDFLPEFASYSPEGYFGHYLMMLGALGGRRCTAAGRRYGEYESVSGTGQVHVWFDRPDGGWTA
jgi:3,4-dihydroxyphenylacetate 2,3-dioxygenase